MATNPKTPANEGVPAAGDNLTSINTTVQEVFAKVMSLKEDRDATGAEILAERERLKALGIDKEAFDIASKYMGWNEHKRRSFDLAYSIVRNALGVPVQADLFDSLEDNASEMSGVGEEEPEEENPEDDFENSP